MLRPRILSARSFGLLVFLISLSAAGNSPVLLDRKDLRVDFASTTLELTETTPHRVVLNGLVTEIDTVCTNYQTVVRTYMGCTEEDGQNACTSSYQECTSEEFVEYSRNRKIVLKFGGVRPQSGTLLYLNAKDSNGYFSKPSLTSNDPCLRFEIREGKWPIERRKPLVIVHDTCPKA